MSTLLPLHIALSALSALSALPGPVPAPAAGQGSPAPVASAAPQAPSVAPTFRWVLRDTTRVEAWRFFEPAPGGGDPTYAFVATRLFAGLDYRAARLDVGAGLQYVQFGGLPSGAVGPGPLGTGPQYFAQGGGSTSHQVYLRTAFIRLKRLGIRGVSLQAGRFGYASGGESPSGHATIEAVKRQRLDARLVGEFEWSLYQRTFDGGRLDVDRRAWHATGAWFRPTQGGFEDQAGLPLRGVGVGVATVNLKPGTAIAHTDVQGFLVRYDDERLVTGRPDNTGLTAPRVDVDITTVGGSAVGAYALGHGQADLLVWGATQRGTWYGEPHRAGALALEGGYQPAGVAWTPWLRGGWFHSTGDRDASDGRHGTFFQVLPTARRYAQSTAYNQMNMSDLFGEVLLRPRQGVTLRAGARRLRLTEPADLWYAGSGATQRTGATFGFAARRSNGSRALGSIVEGSVDWTVSPHVAINGYGGHMYGGAVVTGTFAGAHLGFGYVETVVSF